MEMETEERKALVLDAYDYKGAPADRAQTGGWVSAATILGIEVSERFTTMGIAVNLVTYLDNTMHQPSATSSTIVANFSGVSFLLCLLGGCVADSFLGRYWTIAIFAVIEALGACVLAISATLSHLRPPPCNPSVAIKCVKANNLQMGVFFLGLFAMALGIGGVKSSVSALGTDQFDQTDEKEKTQMEYFFNRFYFLINIGTILAVTLLVYIQDEVSRGVGYGICSAAMLMAVIVFLSRTRRYRYKKLTGSPLIQVIQVIVAAIQKRKLEFPSDLSLLYEDSSAKSKICRTDQFRWLDKATIRSDGDLGKNGSETPNPWRLSTVTRVEELKMMIRLLPIWATTIIFWCVHAQVITFSVQQAASMDRSIGKFHVPAASFSVFFIGATMITLALYDRMVMKKSRGSRGLTNLQKIGLGLAISVIAMAVAAAMEQKRLKVIRANRNTPTSTLPLTAFILIPQFAIVGIAEAFMYSGQLAFFISEAPKGMKAISNSLFLTTISFGYFVTTILVDLIKKITPGKDGGHGWLAPKINDSRLDYFYALISVLSFINLGLYLVCARWYKPNSRENAKDSDVNASHDEENPQDVSKS
ncbi:hypothetical protein AAG906_009698 [Vitis piasezkii]